MSAGRTNAVSAGGGEITQISYGHEIEAGIQDNRFYADEPADYVVCLDELHDEVYTLERGGTAWRSYGSFELSDDGTYLRATSTVGGGYRFYYVFLKS